ncbi:MAG TPA: hypothetical protein VNU21_12140 [Usitatibacter sp.]|nr:hypothetical protein [Usitatibacter sp.]
MSLDLAAVRSNRAVVVAVVVAAVSISLLALIAIAKMLGWVTQRAPATPMSMAAPANQLAGTMPDLALAPGESLVAPAEVPAQVPPMMPHYTPPAAPAPAPAAADAPPVAAGAAPDAPSVGKPEPKATVVAPARAPRPAPRVVPVPRMPSFARGDPHPTSPFDPWPNPVNCDHCGRVVATTTWPHMAEVRVRLDDGSLRILRSPAPTPWHVGDRVRLDHGRLLPD